jgi:hypothetical protein
MTSGASVQLHKMRDVAHLPASRTVDVELRECVCAGGVCLAALLVEQNPIEKHISTLQAAKNAWLRSDQAQVS